MTIRKLARILSAGLAVSHAVALGQYYIEAPRLNIPLARYSLYLPTPDINGNGYPDCLSIGSPGPTYAWLDPGLNGLSAPLTLPLAGVAPNPVTSYAQIQFGLVTRDTSPDLVGIDNSIGAVRLLAGTLSPPFFAPLSATIGGGNTLYLALRDLNADGWDDVIRIQSGPMGAAPYSVTVHLNSYPQWTLAQQISFPRRPIVAAPGDLDGDGNMDLCVMLEGFAGTPLTPAYDDLQLCYGDVSGAFAAPVSQSLGQASLAYPAAYISGVFDLDRDGCDDVFWVESGGLGSGFTSRIRVLWSTPARTMIPGTVVTVPGAVNVQVADIRDIDADGLIDIGFKDINTPGAHYFRFVHNLGNRNFGSELQTLAVTLPGLTSVTYPPFFARADFDLDGDLDLMGHSPTQVHYYVNEAVYARGCAGTGGKVPRSTPGTAFLGSQGSAFYLEDALPQAPALFGISVARNPLGVFPCGIGIDFFGPASFIPRMTDATGFAAVPITIPGWSGLQGAQFSIQWAVADPAGGFTGSTTNIALSEARTVYIW